MSKTFQENKDRATDTLSDMERELSLLQRTHRSYVKHGALTAASEIEQTIAEREREISFEASMYRHTFY